MQLLLWLSLSVVTALTVVQANHHHSRTPKSSRGAGYDEREYIAVTSRHRKNRERSSSAQHKPFQRFGDFEQSNELQQGNAEPEWNPLAELETGGRKQKVWLNFTEANKQIVALIKNRYKNESAILKKPKKQDKKKKKQKDCHSVAMLQCGCESLKSFERHLKEKSYVRVATKCEIRQKFFECLSNASKAECKRQNLKLLKPKSAYQKHKKAIVDVLWTTRECLLGPVDQERDTAMSASEFNINTDFCRKLVHHKGSKKAQRKHSSRSNGKKLVE